MDWNRIQVPWDQLLSHLRRPWVGPIDIDLGIAALGRGPSAGAALHAEGQAEGETMPGHWERSLDEPWFVER